MKNTASYDNVSVTLGRDKSGLVVAAEIMELMVIVVAVFHVSPIQLIMHHIIKIIEIMIQMQHQMPVPQQHRVDHMMWLSQLRLQHP